MITSVVGLECIVRRCLWDDNNEAEVKAMNLLHLIDNININIKVLL